MFKNKAVALLVVTIGAFSLAPTALAQLSDAAISAVDLAREYRIVPNITYLRADNWDAKLDVYLPRDVSEPNLHTDLHPWRRLGPGQQRSQCSDLPSFSHRCTLASWSSHKSWSSRRGIRSVVW